MQQLTFVKGGEAPEWREVPEPGLRGAGEALVRPVAVASCDLDKVVVHGKSPWQGPFALGHEFVADVIAVGEDVRTVGVGDRVVVPFQISCGTCERCRRGLTGSCTTAKPGAMYGLAPLGGDWGGALSDLVRVPFADAMLVRAPANVAPAVIASASDNIPDAWRTVAPPLEAHPGADVLVVGGGPAGSIGLYAVAIARALGAGRVDYADRSAERCGVAQRLGASVLEVGEAFPKRFGSYPITVDSGGDPFGLAAALLSTEPGGVCTSASIYFTPPRLPMLEMYTTGVTLKVARLMARPAIPRVLELVASGALHPETITSETASWTDAGRALLGYRTKLVVTR